MYKFNRNHQLKLSDFNQPIGLKINLENWWSRFLKIRIINLNNLYLIEPPVRLK